MRHPNRMNGGTPSIGTCAKKKATRMSAWLARRGITVEAWREMSKAERKAIALQ